jgi:hypothetical protein
MTTANKIAAIFAVATNNFTPIAGQPTDNDINTMEKALLMLLHDIDYDMYGSQNLVGIIEPTITYTVTWGQAFGRPPRLTVYDLTIQDNATPAVHNRIEVTHTLLLERCRTVGRLDALMDAHQSLLATDGSGGAGEVGGELDEEMGRGVGW